MMPVTLTCGLPIMLDVYANAWALLQQAHITVIDTQASANNK